MLIALYERTVGLYASIVGINPYNQPGVEAGKKAAADVLDLQTKLLADLKGHAGEFRTAEEIATAVDAEAETVFILLSHFAANPEKGVGKHEGETPLDATFGMK